MSNTILHHLMDRREKSAKSPAIQFKENGRWLTYNWHEYFQLSESLGAALVASEISRQDRVVIMSDTRPEWIFVDMAIMGVGAITIPIYPNNFDEDVAFVVNNSEAKILFLEDRSQIEKWHRIESQCPSVKHVIVIDTQNEPSGEVQSWAEFLRRGREHLLKEPKVFTDRCHDSKLSDVATILYTSGTTGRPKGVVLTHEQIMSELTDVFSIINVTQDDVSLSFLPYSHIFGRIEAWANIYTGFLLAFAESIEKIKYNLTEVKPTFLIAVPRIFEKIYAGILAQVANSRIKREVFERALSVGKKVSERTQAKKNLGLPLAFEYAAAYHLVFKNIMNGLGGRMRFAVSGGAPLSPDISKFFHGLGLLICEGYGLTETTAGITFNTPYAFKLGTCGKPIGDVEIKIAEDGEILVKSKKVMGEYYKDPAATAEAFSGQYFKTGDIGHLDEDNFLLITDRKKDLIKTAGGKYIAPQKLEGLLKMSPFISNVLVHGDQKKYIIALLTLNPKNIQDYCEQKGLKEATHEARVKTQEIYGLIRDAVAEANTHLASFESIKKFSILPGDFTVETGELTPSLKVKRRFCDQKFKTQIDELYV